MWNYILRRLLLLPLTLFCIILVNFIIINLAPGDPTSFIEISPEGNASRKDDRSLAFSSDERYLQFREFYGLTLPILFNTWPNLSETYVKETLWKIAHRKETKEGGEEIPYKIYNKLRMTFGDQSRYIMPILLEIMEAPETDPDMRRLAAHYFVRGGSRIGYIGNQLTPQQKEWNEKVAKDDELLRSLTWTSANTEKEIQGKINHFKEWYNSNLAYYHFVPTTKEKIDILFFETRFMRYMGRIFTLDFGTLRNDSSKKVIDEVTKRFKYSLTLALIPMLVTFILCQLFGLMMAFWRGRWQDYTLNVVFLILYAIPVFVVAPFLIERIALYHHFPFTDIPIPISGFTSPDNIYDQETSYQRIFDVIQHIALPLVAIMYGSLASEARLSRTAILEVLRQDYVRTAWAKGLSPTMVLFKHVGRNAAITIVTSIAGSLGIVLGGSLIVETLFDINGFGKFFYEAVLNRDYNVIMFSALAGSFLTLLGYLVGDLAYMWLDPRITLD